MELARTGHAKRALTLANEARVLAEDLRDSELTAVALHTLARCHFYVTDFVSSLELMLEAVRIYRALDDATGAATALAGVGLCQHRLGAQEDAIATLLSALESARELGLAALEINIHNSLGSVFLASGRSGDAERHLALGVELASGAGQQESPDEARAQPDAPRPEARRPGRRPGDRAARVRRPAFALSQQALKLARELGNRYDEAHSLGQSGTMLRLLGRTTRPSASLTATLALGRELDETRVQAEALLELGRMHAGRDGAEARRYFADAIERAELTDAKNLLAAACADLSAATRARRRPRRGARRHTSAITRCARRNSRRRGSTRRARRTSGSTSSTPRSRRRSTASRAALLAEDKMALSKQRRGADRASSTTR